MEQIDRVLMQMNFLEFKSKSTRADQKDNDRSHFFSTLFAPSVSYALYRLGFTPNAITGLFLILGMLAAASLYFDLFIVCFLLWRFHIILDMADGLVARATQNFSKAALGFDRTNHIFINASLIFASLYGANAHLELNSLIVCFFANYFFSRNFYSEKQKTRPAKLSSIILRNLLGLEGYLVFSCVLPLLHLEAVLPVVALIYSASFLMMFFVKLHLFIRNEKK